jgi:hypothetical protein
MLVDDFDLNIKAIIIFFLNITLFAAIFLKWNELQSTNAHIEQIDQEKSIDTQVQCCNPSENRSRHPSSGFNAGYGDWRRSPERGSNPRPCARLMFLRATTSFSFPALHARKLLSSRSWMPSPPLSGCLRVWTSGDTGPRHPIFHLKSAAPLLALQTVLRVPATIHYLQAKIVTSKKES